MKKRVAGILLTLAIIAGGTAILGFAMVALQNAADKEVVKNETPDNAPGAVHDIPVLKEPDPGAMSGESGGLLWVDSISDQDYADLMNLLYPNGVLDEQGLEIGGVENLDELRAAFIAERTKAFMFNGTESVEIETTPFYIMLEGYQGQYECLFYQAIIGRDCFVYPSEWGNQSCGFVSASEAGVYLAYTDRGIWRIDPHAMTARKISADSYAGKNRFEIDEEFRRYGRDLFWIDGVQISPDGQTVVYRTNRDCAHAGQSDTSVWAVDLRTGTERPIAEPALNNDIVGFASDNHLVVGSLAGTRIINVSTGAVISVTFPKLPNFSICGVNAGIVIYSSYEDNGASGTTAYISRIDLSTGAMTLITKATGVIRESRFSPSGETVAIGYGTDPMLGAVDVLLVDLATGTKKLLTASVENANQIEGYIRRFQWAYNDALIITTQKEREQRSYIIAVGE